MRRTADYIHCYVVLLIDFCLLLATKHVLLVFYPLNTSMFRLAHWTFTMDFSLPNTFSFMSAYVSCTHIVIVKRR